MLVPYIQALFNNAQDPNYLHFLLSSLLTSIMLQGNVVRNFNLLARQASY
jgi:hypothetical protein